MNRDDIIRMANEAGVYSGANEMVFAASLERFAELVASAEREKIAEYIDRNLMSCREYAEAIRARGQA